MRGESLNPIARAFNVKRDCSRFVSRAEIEAPLTSHFTSSRVKGRVYLTGHVTVSRLQQRFGKCPKIHIFTTVVHLGTVIHICFARFPKNQYFSAATRGYAGTLVT